MGKSGYLMGLVTGAAIGGAAALLLTPKKGEELRAELSQSKNDLKKLREKGNEFVVNAKDKASTFKADAQSKIEVIKDTATEAVEDLNEAAHTKVDEAKVKAHLAKMEAQDKIEELTGTGKV